jgi:tRNA G18 (ribose-2'-O)-methylase SpoU
MRGYFGIGVQRFSKPMNAGNLFRSAHGFGASFAFTIASKLPLKSAGSDTSDAWKQMPYYRFDSVETMMLPANCSIVGVELLDDAIDLPSFHHPRQAAYVLGPEKGSLSPDLVAKCDHVIKIPTQFCINVATAGAIVMYDRINSMGRFAQRPVTSRNIPIELQDHVQGAQKLRTGDLDLTLAQPEND